MGLTLSDYVVYKYLIVGSDHHIMIHVVLLFYSSSSSQATGGTK